MKPSKKSLRNIMLQGLFDPRANGPMKIIVDMNNPDYYEARAIEFIQEAKEAAKRYPKIVQVDGTMPFNVHYYECMSKAIGLLALAQAARGSMDDADFS